MFASSIVCVTVTQFADWCIEIEYSPLKQNHRHRGCRNNFGDGRQVEGGFACDFRRWLVIGELAESMGSDEFAAVRHGKAGSGESTLADGIAQNVEGSRETPLLVVVGGKQRVRGLW